MTQLAMFPDVFDDWFRPGCWPPQVWSPMFRGGPIRLHIIAGHLKHYGDDSDAGKWWVEVARWDHSRRGVGTPRYRYTSRHITCDSRREAAARAERLWRCAINRVRAGRLNIMLNVQEANA